MNAILKIKTLPDAAKIAHSIMAYDRATENLDLELPIPLFLDTLALKVAQVPAEDKYGAYSYPLEHRAVDTFRFLLGLEVDLAARDYFIESTVGNVPGFPKRKLEALEVLSSVTPHPRYTRTDQPRISERELVLPTLRLINESKRGWMATGDLILRLTKLFDPAGQDAQILAERNDSHFSQKVRNMISHRHQPSSFINRGLAHYVQSGLKITALGRSTVDAVLS